MIHREDGVPPSKSNLRVLGGAFNDTVNSMVTFEKIFIPPNGKLWKVIGVDLEKGSPAGAASGVHNMYLQCGGVNHINAVSNFGAVIEWAVNHWRTADHSQEPATNDAQLIALHAIRATAEYPLSVKYGNFTDVANSKSGQMLLFVEEVSII